MNSKALDKFIVAEQVYGLTEIYESLSAWWGHRPVAEVLSASADLCRSYLVGDIDRYNTAAKDVRANARDAFTHVAASGSAVELGVHVAGVAADLDRITTLPAPALTYLGALFLGGWATTPLGTRGQHAWGCCRRRLYDVRVDRVATDGHRHPLHAHRLVEAWSAWRMFWDFVKSEKVRGGDLGGCIGRAFAYTDDRLVLTVSESTTNYAVSF